MLAAVAVAVSEGVVAAAAIVEVLVVAAVVVAIGDCPKAPSRQSQRILAAETAAIGTIL